MADFPEAAVVHSLKSHLIAEGLGGARVGDVIVDADPSYRASRHAKALEPMVTVPIDGFRPDLLCSTRKGSQSLVSAFEVKPRLTEWPKGLAQARAYRAGVHHSYLALPFDRGARIGQLERDAGESGVGLLVLDSAGWRQVVPPTAPRPLPWTLQSVAAVLNGAPVARRLKLNHPLNYLVVPFLRSMDPVTSLLTLLESHWPDLRTEGSRGHAISGARMLGLICPDGRLSMQGATVADLMGAVGFDPGRRLSKQARLAEVSPPLAAVARSVLLGLPATRLITQAFQEKGAGRLGIVELLKAARERDELLAGAIFLLAAEAVRSKFFSGQDISPSMVYQFKQVLWHAGILETKAHPSAGKDAASYLPECDVWALESRFQRQG